MVYAIFMQTYFVCANNKSVYLGKEKLFIEKYQVSEINLHILITKELTCNYNINSRIMF